MKSTFQKSHFAVLTLLVACALLATACHRGSKGTTTVVQGVDYAAVEVPQFDADSAYHFVESQVACGYRTPGSEGQRRCADYLVRQIRRWCDTVIVQDFPTTLWDKCL